MGALQESLTNVHRQSHSSKVEVRLEVANGHAALRVRDYGRGFPPEQLESFRGGSDLGVGTAGMRERVIELGGDSRDCSENPARRSRRCFCWLYGEDGGYTLRIIDGSYEPPYPKDTKVCIRPRTEQILQKEPPPELPLGGGFII
jgi:signal transduction histidine kinase